MNISEILLKHSMWLRGEENGERADLSEADLSGADLSGADLPASAGIEGIDAAILAAISRDGCALDMSSWHKCETTHCRAGWAITLAGESGRKLEEEYGPSVAGALIYAASGSHPVPNWIASDDEAIADMRRRARGEA